LSLAGHFGFLCLLRFGNIQNSTTVLRPSWILSGTTRVSRHQKGKTDLDLLQQEIVSSTCISWAICKSASSPRHINTPASHHSIFTGQMPFLPPDQQRQSTEGMMVHKLPAKVICIDGDDVQCWKCTCKGIIMWSEADTKCAPRSIEQYNATSA